MMIETDEGFPPSTLRRIRHPSGLETEVMLTHYSDRVFVVVTQTNKLGSLLSVAAEQSGQGSTFRIRNLLGRRDDPLLNIYARNIAEAAAKTSTRPLLLAVSLSEEGRSPQVFQEVLSEVRGMLGPK